MCLVLHVRCHMSHVMCDVSCVTCPMSQYLVYLIFKQNVGVSWWRLSYQQDPFVKNHKSALISTKLRGIEFDTYWNSYWKCLTWVLSVHLVQCFFMVNFDNNFFFQFKNIYPRKISKERSVLHPLYYFRKNV